MSHFSYNTGTKYLGFAGKKDLMNLLCHYRAGIWRQQNNHTFTFIPKKNVESLTVFWSLKLNPEPSHEATVWHRKKRLTFHSSNVTLSPFHFIVSAAKVISLYKQESVLWMSVNRFKTIDPTVVEIFPCWTKGLVTDQIIGRCCHPSWFVVGTSKIEQSKTNWRMGRREQLIFLSFIRFQRESTEGNREVSTDCWESCLNLLPIQSDFVR